MTSIERSIASITEDRRAAYLFNTQLAADAVGCDRRKFADWWFRTQRKLIALYLAQPGELAAELAALIALAESSRQRQGGVDEARTSRIIPAAPPPPGRSDRAARRPLRAGAGAGGRDV